MYFSGAFRSRRVCYPRGTGSDRLHQHDNQSPVEIRSHTYPHRSCSSGSQVPRVLICETHWTVAVSAPGLAIAAGTPGESSIGSTAESFLDFFVALSHRSLLVTPILNVTEEPLIVRRRNRIAVRTHRAFPGVGGQLIKKNHLNGSVGGIANRA